MTALAWPLVALVAVVLAYRVALRRFPPTCIVTKNVDVERTGPRPMEAWHGVELGRKVDGIDEKLNSALPDLRAEMEKRFDTLRSDLAEIKLTLGESKEDLSELKLQMGD